MKENLERERVGVRENDIELYNSISLRLLHRLLCLFRIVLQIEKERDGVSVTTMKQGDGML